MTEKRARALHRAMWRWLAKHPGAGKAQWPGWKLRLADDDVDYVCVSTMCFACLGSRCGFDCPIKEKAKICAYEGSLWREYQNLIARQHSDPSEWADVCNRMADAWREIPEGR